ncbi:MAG: HAD family hydrolase [Desulfobacteraceae bacterium]|nr:MAG: HAD family hydrolase [Desulfobacteraceae bacterium]
MFVGKKEFLLNKGGSFNRDIEGRISDQVEQGRTAILVANDMRTVGLIAIADEIRPETSRAIGSLKKLLGIQEITMLTGDNQKVARAVAREIGVDDFQAGLLP